MKTLKDLSDSYLTSTDEDGNEIVKSRENTCSAEWFDFANEIEKRLNL